MTLLRVVANLEEQIKKLEQEIELLTKQIRVANDEIDSGFINSAKVHLEYALGKGAIRE